MNIIARTGAAIAKHKEEAKSILAKYGIDYGNGKFPDLIRASFKAIKSGNKDLASDLVALVKAKEKMDKSPNTSGLSVSRRENILSDLKDKIFAKIQIIRNAKKTGDASVSTADGSGDEQEVQVLIDAVTGGEESALVKEAQKGADMVTALSIGAAIVVILIALAALYFINRKK